METSASCTCSNKRQGKCQFCLDGLVLDRGLNALRNLPKAVDSIGRTLCVCCRKVISPARVAAVGDPRTCTGCQEHFDQVNRNRLHLLAVRAAKPSGAIPRGPSDGDTSRSTRRRLPRAAMEPAY